jgi:Uma2 family endonuclease
VATPPQLRFVRERGDKRIVIRNVGWHVYETLVDSIGERQHVYVAYDGKDLEVMTKGYNHEDYKVLFGRLMSALTFELEIQCLEAGETTWKRPEIARGLEADQSYFFTPKKLAAVRRARARKSDDIADYLNPDLAIEIDISPSQIDRPGIYAALRVSEVWRFDGEVVIIEWLGPKGTYEAIEASRFVLIRPDEVLRWIVEEDASDRNAWERRLRAWIRDELAGRRQDQRKRPRRKP